MPEPNPIRRIAIVIIALWTVLLAASECRAFSAEMQKQLAATKYVYIQSQRKDGGFSKPAEIWFFVHEGAVCVGSKKTTWRARRVKAGRTAARIHVDGADGPAFDATGAIVSDPKLWQLLFDAYAKKYSDWVTYEKNFRQGAADGTYVLIRYTPK